MLASIVALAVTLAALAGAAPSAPAQEAPRGHVVIAVLPYGVPIEAIGRIDGISPGVMSAGIGSPPPAQSFLDIGQGNRVNERLYDSDLLPIYVREGQLEEGVWDRIVRRAEDVPANVIPGLLGSTLESAGFRSASSCCAARSTGRRPGGRTSALRRSCCATLPPARPEQR